MTEKNTVKTTSALPDRLPTDRRPSSLLANETEGMERIRREAEQDDLRRLTGARVIARDHSERLQSAPEGELQNNIKEHPALMSQEFDGTDVNLNPIPALNTEARTEYDNELRLQHQKKMENQPKMGTAPKPGLG